MDDYSQTPISKKFEEAAQKLSTAEGYAFADHLEFTMGEDCARAALLRLCFEVTAKAIVKGHTSMGEFERLLERARDW